MQDALALFALAAAGCSLALVIWIAGRIWLRGKELERATPPSSSGLQAADLAGMLAQIDARLVRPEQTVDATAIDVERVSEAQRFAARAIGASKVS